MYLALYQCLSQALLADEFGWWASHATLALLVAGAAGDAAGSVLRLPAEVACKRLQTGVAAGGDALQALGDVPRSDWLASWAAILARDVPLGGLQVAIYAEAQHSLHTTMEALQAAAPDSAADVLAGAAGGLAAALTNPLDVVVTHCATQEGGGGRGPSASPPTSCTSRGWAPRAASASASPTTPRSSARGSGCTRPPAARSILLDNSG